jgi:uncharacterized membrane protein (UPF0127 family)
MKSKFTLLLVLSIFLVGCSNFSQSSSENNQVSANESSPPPTLSQELPISGKIKVNNQEIELEIAQTPEQQQLGLMFRSSLPDNRGMLFPFSPPQTVKFWMKNVAIPLDMIFLENGTIKAILTSVPPCSLDPCPVYGPDVPIDMVIELNGGRGQELGLQVGDRLEIEFVDVSTQK